MARERIPLALGERAAFDKLVGGMRHSIEGTADLALLRDSPYWGRVADNLEIVLHHATGLFENATHHYKTPRREAHKAARTRRDMPDLKRRLLENDAFKKLTAGLRTVIEGCVEISFNRGDKNWIAISMAIEKVLNSAEDHYNTQLRKAISGK